MSGEVKVSRNKLISVVIGCFVLMMSSSVVSNSQSYFLVTVREYLNCTAAQFLCTIVLYRSVR